MNEVNELRELLSVEAQKERRAYKRTIIIVAVTALLGLLWLGYSAFNVIRLERKSTELTAAIEKRQAILQETTKRNEELKKENEDIEKKVGEAEKLLESAVTGTADPRIQARKALEKLSNISRPVVVTPTPTPTPTPKSTPTPTPTPTPSTAEPTDLSGTYTGTIEYPKRRLTGKAMLTITGNQFTLTNNGQTVSGSITVATTRGYTAVSMLFSSDGSREVVSLAARRSNGSVSLVSLPGSPGRFFFTAR